METRNQRQSFILELLDDVEVRPYTTRTAMLAGKIDGEQRNAGVVIPFTDLLIATTALEVGYSVLTFNLRHFRLVPGLAVLQF